MPDPIDPAPPPPPVPSASPSSDPSSMDLPPNIAAALACIPLVGGVVFYILEKRNEFVRFYAMQSIVFGLAWLLFSIASQVVILIFAGIPAIGLFFVLLCKLISAVVYLAFLVVWIIATLKAFTNVRWDIPYIGPMARKQFDSKPV